MFTIEILQTAINDLEDAFAWYEEQSNGLGNRFIKEIDSFLIKIENNPFHFAIQFSGNYRFATLTKFPYRVVYSIDEHSKLIFVVAVFHTSRNPERF